MSNPIVIHTEQSKGTAFGDERLFKRGASLYEAIHSHRSVSMTFPGQRMTCSL
jgi:hypothetical protein